MELRQGVLQYDGVSTSELLEHIFSNYARIDKALLIVLLATSKMAPPRTSATTRAAAAVPPASNPATAPEPAPVYDLAMDTYMPIIPNLKPDNIEQRFKHPTVTMIENEPDYKQMCVVREELFRNAIAIKSTF